MGYDRPSEPSPVIDKFHWQRPESSTWNPESPTWTLESKTLVDSLLWGKVVGQQLTDPVPRPLVNEADKRSGYEITYKRHRQAVTYSSKTDSNRMMSLLGQKTDWNHYNIVFIANNIIASLTDHHQQRELFDQSVKKLYIGETGRKLGDLFREFKMSRCWKKRQGRIETSCSPL